MAAATGTPDAHEPLLGQRDDLDCPPEPRQKIFVNLITGTASIAQVGVWVLAILIWSDLLSRPLSLFTLHPLLGVSALLLQVQAALILQPTSTPQQKHLGTQIHSVIQLASILCFVGAFTIIEINKGGHHHFISVHGILGLLTVIFVVLQALVGVAQFFLPATIFGSVDAGKRIYKYHRWAGYVLLLLETAVLLAVTHIGILAIPTWSVVLTLILVLLGLGTRIKKRKLGLGNY